MRVEDFENANGVKIRPKAGHWLHSFIGLFSSSWNDHFFTTLRLPGYGGPVIWYPSNIVDKGHIPDRYEEILKHELVHCKQQSTWGGLLWTLVCVSVFPLPVFYSGRWFVERPAYLRDIKAGVLTVDQAVDILWDLYGMPWPREKMRRWFNEGLEGAKPF